MGRLRIRAANESDWYVVNYLVPKGFAPWETWGFLYDLVGFPIRYVSYCILMYLAVYLDVSRSYTSRYIATDFFTAIFEKYPPKPQPSHWFQYQKMQS